MNVALTGTDNMVLRVICVIGVVVCICNSMIWSAIWELIARVRFVISRGEAE